MPPLEYIREKTIEANEDIKKLSKECYFKEFGHMWQIVAVDTIGYICVRQTSNRVQIFTKEMIEYSKGIEIIGRPIQAQDILKVLPHNWMLKSVDDHYEFIDMNHFGTKKFKNTYVIWEKGTLEDQNPIRLGIIATLLGYKK